MINARKHSWVADRPVWSSPYPWMASLHRNGNRAHGAVRSFPSQFVFAVGQREVSPQGFSEDHTGPPTCHGQVGWMPRLPAAGAGRKADPVIISYLHFPEAPPCGRGASLASEDYERSWVSSPILATSSILSTFSMIALIRSSVKGPLA